MHSEHLLLGSNTDSPKSDTSRDFYLHLEDDEEEEKEELNFARRLRRFGSGSEIPGAQVMQEAEPALSCSCEVFTEDLSVGGLLCSTCQAAGWVHHIHCRDSFGTKHLGLLKDIRLREQCAFCHVSASLAGCGAGVEGRWMDSGVGGPGDYLLDCEVDDPVCFEYGTRWSLSAGRVDVLIAY